MLSSRPMCRMHFGSHISCAGVTGGCAGETGGCVGVTGAVLGW